LLTFCHFSIVKVLGQNSGLDSTTEYFTVKGLDRRNPDVSTFCSLHRVSSLPLRLYKIFIDLPVYGARSF
jgi:hypothetical protein